MDGKAARGIPVEAQPSGREMNEYEGEPAVAAVVGDITERKQAEEELREAEGRLRALIENAPDAIWVHDLEGKFTDGNKKAEEIVGYSREELIGKSILEVGLLPEEYLPRAIEALERSIKGEPSGPDEFELIRKDGSRVSVEITSIPVERGGKVEVIGIAWDITKRKRAEEELRNSEEMSRGMLESAATGIYIVQKGKFQYVSPMFEEISGYTSDELIGTYSLRYIHPKDREAARKKAIENLKGQSSLPYEFRCIRKDGEVIWIMDKVASIQYRGEQAAVGSFMDITERKQAEEEILRHAKQVEALHAIAQTVSQTLDLEQMLNSALEKTVEVMGTDTAAIYLLDVGEKALLLKAPTGMRKEAIGELQTVKLTEEELQNVQEWKDPSIPLQEVLGETNLGILAKALDKDQIQSFAIVPLLMRGEVLGAIAIGSRIEREFSPDDIDLLQAIANQIAVGIDNAQLFEEAQAKVVELKEAQEYIVQTERHRALAEMAGGVAHDFNNVLSIVLGRAQLALEDVKETKVKKSLQIIEQSAHDAAKMVRRLQEFAGATVSEELEALDLNQVVKSALQMVESRRIESQVMGVEIDISADLGEVPTVEGNPAELREVLLNIIFNAMDAMPEGGMITIKTAQEDSWVVLSISDTGIGMTKEVQRRIFDPFFTTKSPRGVGLGLSASHGIITKHGGSIEVDSTLGKGSTFYIRLPIFNGTRRKARGNNNNTSHANESAKILLVDDDPEVAEVLELMLRQLGHQVTTVHSGQKALDAFSSEDYDLVITDLYMPDLSGQEVARAVKERKAGVPVLLITGWGLQLDPSEMGVDSMIAKPFSKETLSQQITEVLANGRRV